MKEYIVTNDMAMQRLDKYLKRLLPSCPSGLLYKQLRKKNITLNDTKADGSEIIEEGDTVKIWFSDETIKKFSASEKTDIAKYIEIYKNFRDKIEVIAKDNALGFVIFNKPAGILSQSDKSGDPSINDYLIGYLFSNDLITEESFNITKPSVCNRLDRNTTGIIYCSMNLKGVRFYNAVLRNGGEKYYLALVEGKFDKEGIFEDYIKKNESENRIYFTEETGPDSLYIKTGFELIRACDEISLVKVRLFTGRSHQIRAHLSHLGFPIAGDPKYGRKDSKIKASRQMLHAYNYCREGNPGDRFSWFDVTAPVPEDMAKICNMYLGPIEDYLK